MSVEDDIGQLMRDREEDAALEAEHREREALVKLGRRMVEFWEYPIWMRRHERTWEELWELFEEFHTVVPGMDWQRLENERKAQPYRFPPSNWTGD